jgi:hypothetical protein
MALEGWKGGVHCSMEQRGRENRGRKGLLTERGQEMEHWVAGARWLPVRGLAGEGEGIAREAERSQRQRRSGWPRARAEEKFFKKTEYGRTGQSTVPVRCTPDSAQENRFEARGCRCTGHCTVQCLVHTGLSGVPR